MLTHGHNRILPRSPWTILLAICCILFIFLLIAGTIVLALIPTYLSPPSDINIDTSDNETAFNAIYTSNVVNGRLITLSNTNDLYSQMLNGIPNTQNTINIESAQFLPATEASKKKRQISNGKMSCEHATGLTGDLFTARYRLEYPLMYRTPKGRQQYLNRYQNDIRKKHQRLTVVISLSNGTTLRIQLAFCGFSTADLSTYIYLLDQDSNFFQFNPTTFDVKFVGKLNCSTIAYPYSMALQSNGTAWTLFTDGNIYTFDTVTALCQTTSYVFGQEGLILFGMKFITDTSSGTEKLYITSDSSNLPYRLAMINVNTLEVSIIGYYNNIYGRAELTSTYDERLFGLFEGVPYIVAEINQTNAEILSKTPLNMIQYTPDSSYFAFESYLSNFFLFVGDNTFTDIFIYDSSSKNITKQKTISTGIVGTGVPAYVRDI